MLTHSRKLYLMSIAALALSSAAPVSAQDTGYGESLFQENCAVCHGATGGGDGPVAELFAQRPRNLKLLAKENNNTFPFSEVYQSIDGRRDITAHGNTRMPIWGNYFVEDALPRTIHPGVTAEDIVQGRILGLVYYLQSIQEM